MATSTITVQEVRPQQPGKKTCLVVDVNGDHYYVWPNHAPSYQVGSAYDIAYTVRNFQGKSFRYVDNEPRQSAEAPQAPRARATAPGNSGGASGSDRDEAILVALGIKEAIRAGLLDPHNEDATVILGRRMRSAHKRIWQPLAAPKQAASQQQAANGDMNDDIPF